MEEKTKLFV